MEAALALAHTDHETNAAGVVVARDLSRRYGAGDTAVDALRGVSLAIPRGHLTAVMGPSGSGKSTLMHILAGLDKPTAGSVEIDGVELTTLEGQRPDQAAAAPHRLRLPVLQPAADADGGGERPPAALDRRREARRGVADRAARRDRSRATGASTGRPSSPAASSSASPSRARSSRSRRCSSPTSRRATSTRRPSARSSALLRGAVDTYGQTTVMVTHDPHAATIADRILFLADGVIVKELGALLAGRDPRRRSARWRPMKRVALRGLLARKLRSTLTAIAIVLGVAMVERHARPHRHDRQGVRLDLLELVRADRRRRLRQEARRVVADRQGAGARRAARPGAGAARGRGGRRARSSTSPATPTRRRSSTATARRSRATNPTFGLGVDPADERFNPFELVEGDWASRPGRGRRRPRALPTSRASASATGSKVAGEGPVRSFDARRHRPLRRRRQPRRRHDRALRRRDRARGAGQGRLRRDRRRARARASASRS